MIVKKIYPFFFALSLITLVNCNFPGGCSGETSLTGNQTLSSSENEIGTPNGDSEETDENESSSTGSNSGSKINIDNDKDGYSSSIDCDDNDANIHPNATELCDGIDNDCDGTADDSIPTWYADSDSDGYGDPASSLAQCNEPSGYVADNTDCDDSDASIHPGATELCDGIDNDCDDTADDSIPTWYADSDSDGYGDATTSLVQCDKPSGYADNSSDCNDSDASINSDATEEFGNGVDENCDGYDFNSDTTLVIKPTGVDNTSCSNLSPCLTLKNTLDVLAAGEKIAIYKGDYTETSSSDIYAMYSTTIQGGFEDNGTAVLADPTAGETSIEFVGGMKLFVLSAGSGGVTLDNLNITGNPQYEISSTSTYTGGFPDEGLLQVSDSSLTLKNTNIEITTDEYSGNVIYFTSSSTDELTFNIQNSNATIRTTNLKLSDATDPTSTCYGIMGFIHFNNKSTGTVNITLQDNNFSFEGFDSSTCTSGNIMSIVSGLLFNNDGGGILHSEVTENNIHISDAQIAFGLMSVADDFVSSNNLIQLEDITSVLMAIIIGGNAATDEATFKNNLIYTSGDTSSTSVIGLQSSNVNLNLVNNTFLQHSAKSQYNLLLSSYLSNTLNMTNNLFYNDDTGSSTKNIYINGLLGTQFNVESIVTNNFANLDSGHEVFYVNNEIIEDNASECSDGIDNDGDGDIDTADVDCSTTRIPASTSYTSISSLQTYMTSYGDAYGNTHDDPLFNAIESSPTLSSSSPMKDAGTTLPEYHAADDTDVYDNLRLNGTVDIGAEEIQ